MSGNGGSNKPGKGRPRRKAHVIQPVVEGLTQARIEQGMSQTALANKLGYASAESISIYERGVREPPIALLASWAWELGYEIHFDMVPKKEEE